MERVPPKSVMYIKRTSIEMKGIMYIRVILESEHETLVLNLPLNFHYPHVYKVE